ncbi:MAG: LysM peptidoglycan-binding domain-containing protein [Anaerolineales bacterium]
MRTRLHLPVLLLLGLLTAGAVLAFPAWAAPGPSNLRAQPTAFPTPTPGPDGRIIYIVQEGDSPWRIAAIAGITIEELMAMNGLQSGDYITPGMQLELGTGGPPQPTGASVSGIATATSPPMTPTPQVGTGEICVLLFEDVNGDGRLEAGEPALAGGQISVAEESGVVAAEYTSEALDLELYPAGYCFEDLMNGSYNVSAAAPEGYNPTTGLNAPVTLNPGDIKYLQFGAQPSAGISTNGGGGGRSALLGVLGVVLLVSAGALGYYATRISRRTPRSLR